MKIIFLKIRHCLDLECGGTPPLSHDASCRVVPKRGLARAQMMPLVKIGLVCAVLLAGALQAAALDGVVIIANEGVPVDTISAAALKDIYTGRTTYWPDGQSVKLAVLDNQIADKTDAALAEISGMDSTSQFKTFWQRMVFSGRGQMPQKFGDTASLEAYVAATKGAIAIVLEDADLKDVKKLEIK